MSDHSEERKDILEENEEDLGSTIFSAPEEKKDRVEKPKLLKRALAIFLAVAILVGITTGIFLLVPELVGDEPEETQVNETEIINSDLENYSAVIVKNGKETLDFYVVESESEATSSDSEPTVVRTWIERTVDPNLVDTSTISSFVKSAIGLKYAKIIAEEYTDGNLYGFDSPSYTVSATKTEGETLTLTVGKQSPDKSGYYVTSSADSKVYLVKASYLSSLDKTKLDLAKSVSVAAFAEADGSAEYYSSGALAKFDYMKFSNSTVGSTYTINCVDQEDTAYKFNSYYISSPLNRGANDDMVSQIVALFSTGFSADGVYSYTKTGSDLTAFGLDKPDLLVEVKAGTQQRELKAKLQSDGYYAVISSDIEVIMKVSPSALTVANYKESDLYSPFLFIAMLAEVQDFIIEFEDTKHTFGIVTEYDEENEQTDITGVRINGGVAVGPESFQDYYTFLIGMTAVSYDAELVDKEPKVTITMTQKDGSAPMVVRYYAAQDNRYLVEVNGMEMGLIGSANFKNIMKYADNVAAGREYNHS